MHIYNWSISKDINLEAVSSYQGTFSGVITRDIMFSKTDTSAPLNSKYYMVSTVAFDQHWSQDEYSYIPKILTELFDTPIHDQYNKFVFKRELLIETINNSGIINAPVFTFETGSGIPFEDGRNRFSLIRELGIMNYEFSSINP